jgi:Stigma-specific protein, Stig1
MFSDKKRGSTMRQTVVRSFLVACACLILGGACGSSGKKTADAMAAAPKDGPVIPPAPCSVNGTSYAPGETFVANCVTFTCVNGAFTASGLPCNTDASVVVVNIPDALVAQDDTAAKDLGVSDVPMASTPDAGSDVLLAQDLVEQVDMKVAVDVAPDSTSAIADVVPSPDTPSVSVVEVGIIQPIQDAAAEVGIVLVPDAKVVVDSEPDAKVVVPDAASDVLVPPDAPPCPSSNLLFCSEKCVDGRFDPSNCGSCGRNCATGEYCSAGVCQSTIGNGIVICDGSYRDTQNDPRFCGGCNTSCRADQDCLAGVCGCTNGLVDCGGACVDTQTSNANCGTCGNACLAVQSCGAGVCRCPTGRRLCGTACVDYLHDSANCGDCGNVCASGTTCVYDPGNPSSGVLWSVSCRSICGSGTTFCNDNQCHNLQAESANCGVCGNKCRTDQSCISGTCQCPNGLTDCNGVCVDIGTNAANCGGCGISCPAGFSCFYGTSPSNKCQLVCTGGTTACGNSCRDLMSDPNNCKSCGNACPLDEYCVNGVCDVRCPTSQSDCSKVCVDESKDSKNCGGCGIACPADQFCSNGTCQCIGGKTKCSNNGIISCSDTTADPLNCGTCGTKCPTGKLCQASVCSCPGSTTWCGSACVDTSANNQNCGACGVSCLAPRSCLSGSCQCQTGQTLCGTSCVNESSDPANCGGCGVKCATSQLCQGGLCGCSAAGTVLCNGSCVNYATDRNNCGSCGYSCGIYGFCQSSACVGSYEMCACRTTNFNCLKGFTLNDRTNTANLTVPGSAVLGSLGATLVAPSSMIVSFHYYTTAVTCDNGGLPRLEIHVGNNSYPQDLPCQSTGSLIIPVPIPVGTGISDISFAIFSGDWGLSVVIDSITFN